MGETRPFDDEIEDMLWKRIKPVIFNTDHETHEAYMFGDKNRGLPWCLGYSFGRSIVKDYMQKHPDISFLKLLDVSAKEIFEEGRYDKI